MQSVFRNRADRGNSHEGEHQCRIEKIQTSGDAERVLQPGRNEHHADEADHDRGQRSKQFDKRLDDTARGIGSHFREVGGRHQSERNRKQACQEGHGKRTGNQRTDFKVGLIADRIPIGSEDEVEKAGAGKHRKAFTKQIKHNACEHGKREQGQSG